MRYFTRIRDNPEVGDYMRPKSLHRLDRSPGTILTQRWDKKKKKWVDDPNLIAFTGIGGADDYREIDKQAANNLLRSWGIKEKPESAIQRAKRHYGPGPHPGTGTDQDVHAGGGGGGGSKPSAGDPSPGAGSGGPSKFPDKETLGEFETGSEPGEANLRSRDFVGSGISRRQENALARAGLDNNPISLDEARGRLEEFGISVPEDALQIAYWRVLEERGEITDTGENQASMNEITHQLFFMGAEKPDPIDDSTYLDFGPDHKQPQLVRSLKAAEERFLDSPTIQLAAFDENGNEVYADKGKVSSVTLPDPNEIDLRGSYIIHNHPAGNSLTKEDVAAGFEHGVKEIYASGGDRRYIARYPDAIQNMPPLLREMGAEDIWFRASAISQAIRSDQTNDVEFGRTEWWQAESQHNHLVLDQMVQNRDRSTFTYHIEKIEDEG